MIIKFKLNFTQYELDFADIYEGLQFLYNLIGHNKQTVKIISIRPIAKLCTF